MKLPPPNTDPQADVEAEWARLRDAMYAAASDVVGPVTRKNQDWFDENNSNIQTRLEDKRRLHRALLNDPSSVSKKDAYDAMKKTKCKTNGSESRRTTSSPMQTVRT